MATERLPSLRRRLMLALAEDQAFQDITTARTIRRGQRGRARLVAKAPGVLSGLSVFKMLFHLVDKSVETVSDADEGSRLRRGQIVARLDGPLAAILRGERVALNLLCHLSGIATETAACVAQTRGTRTKILDTRKTTPLWRDLERAAVRAGGGVNHRDHLADMILVKDNHIDACGGIAPALERVFRKPRPRRKVIVETRTLRELRAALEFPVDVVLLDNMPPARLRDAVALARGRALVEVSGGVKAGDIRRLARLGVDRVSLGRLTHSAPALDFSLQVSDGEK